MSCWNGAKLGAVLPGCVCVCVLLGGGPWDAMGCQHALLAWCYVCVLYVSVCRLAWGVGFLHPTRLPFLLRGLL